MYSIMEMEPEQRDAVLFWIKDMEHRATKEMPLVIIDNYYPEENMPTDRAQRRGLDSEGGVNRCHA